MEGDQSVMYVKLLNQKAGLVTGSTVGLGCEVLLAACAEGAAIVGLDLDEEAGQATVSEAIAAGGRAIFHRGDVTDMEDVANAILRCQEEYGSSDLVDNNAVIAVIAVKAHLHEHSSADWDAVINVNLEGTFNVCKLADQAMLNSGGGSIVNAASIVNLTGDPLLPSYATTKTGLIGLTRVIAVDYAAKGIRCNCV